MNTETTQAPEHDSNGGQPTDLEALLAAQVDTIGDNPTVDPGTAAAPAGEKGAPAVVTDPPAPAVPAVPATPAGETPAAAPSPAPAAAPAPAAEVVDPVPAAAPPAPTPAVAAPAPAPAPPVPPKDFDAAYAAIQKSYDDGELDSGEFQAQTRALTKEETTFNTRLAMWEENVARTQQAAAQDFNSAALAWEKSNADFMSNPLRRDSMQRAIAVLDQETGGKLTPSELIERAGKAAFEAFGYKPAEPVAAMPAVDEAAAIAAATAARKAPPVPTTLGNAPSAGAIDRGGGSALFAELDGKDINTLEDIVARMGPKEREDYLRDAPGAKSTGLPE